MEKHNLEEYFNRRISQHSEFIDKDELWGNLDMEEKKNRKSIFWIWGSVILLLLIASIFIFKNSQNALDTFKNTDKTIANVVVSAEKDDLKLSTSKNSETVAEESIVGDNQESDVNDAKANIDAQSFSVNNYQTRKKNIQNKNLNTKKGTSLRTENISANSLKSNLSSNKTKQLFTNEKVNQNQRDNDIIKNQEINSVVLPIETAVGEHKKTAPIYNQEKLENLQPELLGKELEKDVGNEKKNLPILKDETEDFTISEKKVSTTISDDKFSADNQKEISEDINEIVLNESVKPLSFGLYADAALINRNLTSMAGNFDTLGVIIRNQAETTLERVGFGAYLKYETPSGLYFKLGANYTSLNTELRARILSEEVSSKDDFPLTIIIKEEGDTLGLNFGTLIERTIVEKQLTIYTSHKIIDIPLSIGYQHNIGKWSIFGELRPSFSILHSYRGQIYNGQILADGNRYVDTSTKFSLASAVGVSYKLGESLNIWAQPYYQVSFNSYMDSNTGQSEKYKFMGLRLGTELQF